MTFNFRLVFITFAFVASLLSLSSCRPAPLYPKCKNDSDCNGKTKNQTISGVCVFGECQECRSNTDCIDDKICSKYRCVANCGNHADCSKGEYCLDGLCAFGCSDDDPCTDGKKCIKGKCISMFFPCSDNLECEDGYICEQGLCSSKEDMQKSNMAKCENDVLIYFDFDQSIIKPQNAAFIENIAKCLKTNSKSTVTLVGHTDDRGSSEYNMALGEQRALSVARHLGRLGISKNRIKVISYGEDEPAVIGTGEEVWSKNRRCVVNIEKKEI